METADRRHQEVRRHPWRRRISYTTSPVHTDEYFVKLAEELEKMGADTICIKDMANLLLPYDAY